MDEVWKDIPNYEGIYQVSNLGRVKSFKYKNERILKQGNDGKGYLQVCLMKNSKRRKFTIHQLVAMAFLDHTPNGMKIVVDHIDGNKNNNNLSNLQLLTQRQNTQKSNIVTTSKYIGVTKSKDSKKWRSTIKINGKNKHLGMFKCELAAAVAYNKALKELENE